MPEDSKRNQKGKHDAKEQRRKRQPRQQAGPVEKKQDKESDPPKETPKASAQPAHQPPGPEFYKGLKRETDEILKITEEENSKYRKKEIQSNWAKYEMPVESYDEMDEQAQQGADYETLIQAPLSVGTHFQFKHEKSWDVTSGPSPYEKYFDIDMGNLVVAISTIPFYERNSIDKSIFNESDLQSMDHRATKYKQKYYNDNKYNTPDLEAQNNIISKLCNKTEESDKENSSKHIEECDIAKDEILLDFKDIKLEDNNITSPVDNKLQNSATESSLDHKKDIRNVITDAEVDGMESIQNKLLDDNEVTNTATDEHQPATITQEIATNIEKEIIDDNLLVSPEIDLVKKIEIPVAADVSKGNPNVTTQPQKESKSPIIESPEDLEKWLDDFLDD